MSSQPGNLEPQVHLAIHNRASHAEEPVPLLSKRLAYWGWLRMLLGAIQMACAASAVFAIFRVGLEPITWALIFGAFASTAISRLLYRGRRDPNLPDADLMNNKKG